MVDSGAIYSVVPAAVLRRLGLRALGKDEFILADGSKAVRRKRVALFRYGKRLGGGDVIFGEPGDSALLGARTLEALGPSLDPVRRELRPLPMILGGWRVRLRAGLEAGGTVRVKRPDFGAEDFAREARIGCYSAFSLLVRETVLRAASPRAPARCHRLYSSIVSPRAASIATDNPAIT